MEAPRKKRDATGLLILALLALAAFVLGSKKGTPPGPQPILRSVGEPDITPAGTINQGGTKIISWICENTGNGDGLAVLRIDQVSPTPATGILLGVDEPVLVGQRSLLVLTGVFNQAPGDYTLRVAMLNSTTAARPVIDSRTFPLVIGQPTPQAILTAGTLVVS